MDDSADKERVVKILEALRYSVVSIPTGRKESPDLRATKGQESFLIEIKKKGDDEDEAARREEAFRAGEVHSYCLGLGRQNTVSCRIKKGCNQLSSHRSPQDLCLLWFAAEGTHPHAHYGRILSTLYGLRYVVDIGQNSTDIGQNSTPTPECFYFENSEFYNRKDVLSGVILEDAGGVTLLVNDLHERADEFRKSSLYASFLEYNGVCDPPKLEAQGIAYIVGGPVDRRKEGEVLDYLSRKYGLKRPISVMPSEHGAEVCVPNHPFRVDP